MSEQKRPGNKHISVCIDRSLYEKFESYCRDAGLSKPEAYTIAVRAYIEEDMRASAPRKDSMAPSAGDADDFRFLSVGVERLFTIPAARKPPLLKRADESPQRV